MKDSGAALRWIITLMEDNNIHYQVVGGLAAKTYGATRELVDIDLYVSGHDFHRACELASEFITWGPSLYKDEDWDIEFAKFCYLEQKVEIGKSEPAKRYDREIGAWVNENIDYDDFVIGEYLGVTFKTIPKNKLIAYKRKLNREVDILDIQQMQ